MSTLRRVGLTLASTALSLGLVALVAPASHADTSWDYNRVPVTKTK